MDISYEMKRFGKKTSSGFYDWDAKYRMITDYEIVVRK